ncbi:cytochrome b/b6 domain-containing protein [Caulobacter sp. CCH9-E1]|uniref:cytochrome b/b6 domain-containing protein n=1 Tax=Caulobacter sp. CCH9-E1 TaxID=1768768 RepID=UPI000836E6F7|nr:cytochrome b/b6 domain-containing protein [Caulobacter sp. CCH9-E1]
MAVTRTRYTTVAIVLHWLIAAAIIFQIIIGWRMGDGPKGSPTTFALFQLHKSIGFTILLLSVARLAWRIFNRTPAPPVHQPRWEQIASKIVHVGFYVIMIGLPLTGWILVSTSRVVVPTLWWGVIPWPHLPGLPELAAGPKHVWHEIGEIGHGVLVKLTYLLLALHLGAVAKHQVLDKDEVFQNMAPGAKPGLKEPRVWLAAAGLAAVIAAGYLFTPTLKVAQSAPPPAPAAEIPAIAEPATPTPAETAVAAVEAAKPEAVAAEAPPALKDPVAWAVQKGAALTFSATWSGTPIEGRFNRWTADILFSPEALDRSKLTVSIDMGSAVTGDDQRDQSLPSGDFFDTAEHPKAIFTAAKFRKTGEGQYVADGTLDLRGVKKPLSLPFSLKIVGDTATARGVTTLDRTTFGVGQGEWASTDQIAAKVKVSFSLTAKRK